MSAWTGYKLSLCKPWCRCARPPVCTRTHKNDHVCTLKIRYSPCQSSVDYENTKRPVIGGQHLCTSVQYNDLHIRLAPIGSRLQKACSPAALWVDLERLRQKRLNNTIILILLILIIRQLQTTCLAFITLSPPILNVCMHFPWNLRLI